MTLKKTHTNKTLLRVFFAASAVILLCGVFCGAATAAAPHSIFVDTIGLGSVEASPGEALPGEEVTLTCKPYAGFVFTGWEVSPETVKIENNRFIMPNEPVTVTAVFEVICKKISPDENGTVLINLPAFPFDSDNGGVFVVSASNIGGDELTYTAWGADVFDLPDRFGYTQSYFSAIRIDAALKDQGQPSVLTMDVTLPNPALNKYVCLKHYTGDTWETVMPEASPETVSGDNTFRYKFPVSSYGQIAVLAEVPDSDPVSSQMWEELIETMDTTEPTEIPQETPTDVLAQQTAEPQKAGTSPVPFIGILAGLGAAAVIFGLRRR